MNNKSESAGLNGISDQTLENEFDHSGGLGDFLDNMVTWLSDYWDPYISDLDDKTIYGLVDWYRNRKNQQK